MSPPARRNWVFGLERRNWMERHKDTNYMFRFHPHKGFCCLSSPLLPLLLGQSHPTGFKLCGGPVVVHWTGKGGSSSL
jgi:hypothetical protein